MPLYQAIVLAIVQAFTEFLPISSTAHLILFPWLLGWKEPGLAFDVALHAGTLLSVLVYFFRDWIELLLPGVGIHFPASASAEEVAVRRRLFWFLMLGTIPAGAAGLLFHHLIEEKLRLPIPIGIALIAVGLLMWWADSRYLLGQGMNKVTLADSLVIGVAQALALFPGVSRSGITIIAGLRRGMTREASARFSFLLATPVIAGAVASELPKLLKLRHAAGGLEMPLSTLLTSIGVSGLVGCGVIALFLRYLQVRSLKIFVYYRLAFGIVILLLAILHSNPAR